MRYGLLATGLLSFITTEAQITFPDNSGTTDRKIQESGLHYIIHPVKGDSRTEIRLIIGAGSLMENPEQAGVAHFLEHLVFKKTLFGNLNQLGVKLERDFNASTHYESTIYKISVPNTPENIGMCLEIFRKNIFADLFSNVSKDDIEKEKNVIIQELRDRGNEGPFYHEKIGNSIFRNKLPGGTEADIRKINKASLESYFRKWYTTGNAHIIIVGDINTSATEKKITSLFHDKGHKASEITSYSQIDYASLIPTKSIFSLQQGKQKNMSTERIIVVQRKPEDLKATLMQKLYSELIRQGIKDTGLQNVTFFDDWYMGNIFHSGFEIRSKDKADLLKTYEQLGALSEQVKKTEIQQELFDTIKQKVIKNTFTPVPTNAKDIAAYYEDIIGRHKYVLPSESGFLAQKILNELKEEEIRSYSSLLSEEPHFNLIQTPSGLSEITEQELTESFQTGIKSGMKIQNQEAAKEEVLKEAPLIHYKIESPKKLFARVISEKKLDRLNASLIKLSNGIDVILAPDSKAEKNTIIYYGRGGFSQLSDHKYPFYKDLNYYANQIGIKPYKYNILSDILSQNSISYSSYIGSYANEIRITAPDENMELAFKLLYHSVYNYVLPVEDFKGDIKQKLQENDKEEQVSENEYARFQQAEELFLGNYRNTENKKLTKQELKKLDIKKLFAFYDQVFRNTNNRAVLISGNFNIHQTKDLITKYFGAYKPDHQILQWQSDSSPAILNKDFAPENQTRKDVALITKSPVIPSAKNIYAIQLAKELLQARFFETARNKYGKVYSPSVSCEYKTYPVPSVSFIVKFRSEKEDIPFLKNLFLDLMRDSVDTHTLENSKKALLISIAEKISDPYSKEKEILQSYLDQLNTDDLENYESLINSVTTDDIKAILNSVKSVNAQLIQ
ncbi:insulinase family protein [Elizabethkingia miricola]|uniref:insulinase family protein n=1 Tax=Elizabethkingia miricola TaxID=172045 RepID=UPI0009998F55|nr:insulinase family protein [Elizabethkingia miricola]OPC34494.1 hypothetical protein BAX99_06370 [Elizabethkingia miricola]